MDPFDEQEGLGYDPYLFQGLRSNPSSEQLMGTFGSLQSDSNFDPSSLLASEIRGPKEVAIPTVYINEAKHINSPLLAQRDPEPNVMKPRLSKRRAKRTAPSGSSNEIPVSKKGKVRPGKPGKPGQPRPPGCSGKTQNSLSLAWQPPKDSGGFEVDAFQVQKRAFESGQQSVVPPWKDIFPKQGYPHTTYELTGLRAGSLTQFRVKAHNRIGWGKFSRASNPFPTEMASDDSKGDKKVEGTMDPSMIQWDVPKIRLGRGAFGVVFRSAVGGYRGTTVAVKIERNARYVLDDRTEDSKTKMESWLREVRILASLRHPNLVLFMGACQCEGRLYILTEYMSGGSLENAIYRPINPLRDKQWIQSILAQVASAMEFLHSNNPRITHRDLKPANVLLDKTWVHAKVCDFGFARMHTREVMSTLTKFAGTTPYMAPEALGEDAVSSKVDVYSFGILVAEALLHERPFPKYSNAEVMKAVCIRNERPFVLKNRGLGPVETLVEECWHTNPENRPLFATIIKHLTSLGWKMV